MPASTEQIIHPAAFFVTRDAPTKVALGALSNATASYDNDLGEFETRLFLFENLNDQNESVRGAAGWDGDRYAVVNTPQGPGIVWLTVWDSPVEAGEFFDIAGQSIAKRFKVKPTTGANNTEKSYSTSDRSLLLSAVEVQGRPVVIYVDVPRGASTSIIQPSQVRLTQ
jgi:hypothetical protein